MNLLYGGLMLCVVAGVVAMVVGKYPKHLSAERKSEMIMHARDNNMSIKEAAEHFEVSYDVIRSAAIALEIVLPRGRKSHTGKQKTVQEKKRMIEFARDRGMSIAKAARHFNVDTATIRAYAKDFNIELPRVRCGHLGNGTPGRVRLFWSCRTKSISRRNGSKPSARACFRKTPLKNSAYQYEHFKLCFTSYVRVKVGSPFGGPRGELWFPSQGRRLPT